MQTIAVQCSKGQAQEAAATCAAYGTSMSGRHRHSFMQQSSLAEASSVGSVGCHRTQFTSSGCACSRLHSSWNEPPPLPLPTPSPPCFKNNALTPGSASPASSPRASPNIRIALSALPLAISPSLDQSTVKMVRSWYPESVDSSRHRSSPAGSSVAPRGHA